MKLGPVSASLSLFFKSTIMLNNLRHYLAHESINHHHSPSYKKICIGNKLLQIREETDRKVRWPRSKIFFRTHTQEGSCLHRMISKPKMARYTQSVCVAFKLSGEIRYPLEDGHVGEWWNPLNRLKVPSTGSWWLEHPKSGSGKFLTERKRQIWSDGEPSWGMKNGTRRVFQFK